MQTICRRWGVEGSAFHRAPITEIIDRWPIPPSHARFLTSTFRGHRQDATSDEGEGTHETADRSGNDSVPPSFFHNVEPATLQEDYQPGCHRHGGPRPLRRR